MCLVCDEQKACSDCAVLEELPLPREMICLVRQYASPPIHMVPWNMAAVAYYVRTVVPLDILHASEAREFHHQLSIAHHYRRNNERFYIDLCKLWGREVRRQARLRNSRRRRIIYPAHEYRWVFMRPDDPTQ